MNYANKKTHIFIAINLLFQSNKNTIISSNYNT